MKVGSQVVTIIGGQLFHGTVLKITYRYKLQIPAQHGLIPHERWVDADKTLEYGTSTAFLWLRTQHHNRYGFDLSGKYRLQHKPVEQITELDMVWD